MAKSKKYEDLPEIPDYERADLEIYERTEMDEKERERKAFEPPQICIPEDEVLQQVDSKRKGSYQRGSANENGVAEKQEATIRKGSLRPISENEALATTLKSVPVTPVIEVCYKIIISRSINQVNHTLTFIIDTRCSCYQRK